MNKVSRLKGMLTKAWNSGKYTKQEFCDFVNNDWLPKQPINNYEWLCELKPHAEMLMNLPLKCKKPQARNHNDWYVYFYFLENQLDIPVYIGKTYDIGNRLQQHIRQEKRHKLVKYVLCCHFNTNADAEDFEAYYTRHLQPEWNIDNKEQPSTLYKLPAQELKPWAPSTTLEDPNYRQIAKDVNFMRTTLIPNFQKTINAISA